MLTVNSCESNKGFNKSFLAPFFSIYQNDNKCGLKRFSIVQFYCFNAAIESEENI